jgi:MFS family permease
MPLYATHLGASESQVGLVVAAYSYITALTLIPFGMLSDRAGGRNLLIGGLMIYILAPFLYPLANTPAELIAVRGIHGLASASFIPAATALVLNVTPGYKRGEALGWFGTFAMVGLIAGPAVGGFLFSHYNFRFAFYGSSVIAALGLMLILIKKSTIPGKSVEGAIIQETSWNWLGRRRALGALLTPLLVTFGSGTIVSFMPLYGVGLEISAVEVSLIITALYTGSALLRIPGGRLSDKIGRRLPILCGLALGVGALFFTSQSSFFSLLAVAALLYGVGMGLCMPSAFAMLADASPVGTEGLAMGMANASLQVGFAIGASSMGFVAHAAGFEHMFQVCALSLTCGTLALLMLTAR